jgi:hypothetical protein
VKQRQTSHRSEPAKRPPGGRAPAALRSATRRDRERVRDIARRPKKYCAAGQLLTGASEDLAKPHRRRPTVAPGRAPVPREVLVRDLMVTDRDLVVRARGDAVAPGATSIGDFLTDRILTARPDWTTDQAMRAMAEAQVGRLPVVDDRGTVVGVVTLSSLVLRSRDQEAVLEVAKEVARRSARGGAVTGGAATGEAPSGL